MAKRMRLFDLSDDVQVLIKKSSDDDGDPTIENTFVTEMDGAIVDMKLTGGYSDFEKRDEIFETLTKEKLTQVFNKLTDEYPLDIPKI